MASKVYCKMWLATCDDIADVLLREKVTQALEPVTEPLRAHRIFASLYARYVMIVNRLGDIYDQTLQVQKRALVRRVLELATQRLVELQLELKNIEMSEFLYIDQTLIEEKYGVEDVQMLSPFYYPMPRSAELQAVLDGVRKPPAPPKEVEDGEEEAAPMTTIQMLLAEQKRLAELEASRVDPWADAIRLLQIHEKARQARCQFTYIRLHPHIYYPQPPEHIGPKPYFFYHKPDTPMLIPVKHTMYESNFYRKLRTFSQVQFYVNPLRALGEAPAEKVRDGDGSDANGSPETVTEEPLVATADDKQAAEEAVEPPVVIDAVVDAEDEGDARKFASMLRTRDAEIERTARRERRNAAATRIQRCFLRWQIKRRVRETIFERYCRLGMADRRRWDYRDRDFTESKRRATAAKKAAFDEAFRRACEDTRNRIVQLRTPWIMEDISDHIRAWFRDMWLASEEREFDKYPPAAKGGTILVLQGLTPSPWEFVEFLKRRDELAAMTPEQRKKIADEAKKAKQAVKKAAREAKKKKALAKAEKKKAQLLNGPSWEFQDDDFITKNFLGLDQQMIDYKREWRFIDEFDNPSSAPYMDWVQLDEYAKVHMELRAVVDELMRVEYEMLQMARAVDQKRKYKAPKPPKAKKAKRGKKKKEPPPITFGDRDVEEVYDELLARGVIKSYPKRRMEDLIGDRNFCAYEMRNFSGRDPLHCMGEVKDVLRHYILGMGDIQFKHPKSMCLFGPPGCGKKYMVDALANEMGVIKFDLSARVVCQFQDDIKTFVDNVLKMARLMQPSMLFMDGAHNPFIKKIAPENVADQPKLIAPYLPKMVKALKPTDRVMLLGTTNEPWNCALGPLKKCFEVMVMCPGADYGTTLLTWRTAVLGMEGTDRMMDFSALAKVTQQYGIKQMLDTVNRVVDLKRRVFLERRPLKQDDLLEDLLTGIPPNFPMDPAELAKYTKFFAKVNKYQKVRAKKMADIAAVSAAAAKK